MKHIRNILIVVVAIAALAVVSFGTWRLLIARASLYTDADTIRDPARSAPVRDILWQPAAPVRNALSPDADEYEPRLSADGTLMVFVRGRPGGAADLWSSRWTPGGWTAPEPIASINSPNDELGPELSRDGQRLLFYSDRPGGLGGHDIWISQRIDSGWSEPSNLGPAVNTQFNEYGPALTPDGSALYFSSNRLREGEPPRTRDDWPATLRESRDRHDYDLYIATLDQGTPQRAVPLTSLNTTFDEGAPAVSPAGDFVYFASDRPHGFGGFDVLRSRRLRGSHAEPENLGPAVNSDANELDPALSMEGFRIYFSSNRALPAQNEPQLAPQNTAASPAEPLKYALWTSASREVFLESRPSQAWSTLLSLISAILPWLLAALLATALLWLLRHLLRMPGLRRGIARLSLLAQCILLSLLIHALLASLLAIWRVGSQLGDMLNDGGGGSKVILASFGEAGGVAGQIRAGLAPALSVTPEIVLSRAPFDPATLEARSESISPLVETVTGEALPLTLPEVRPEPAPSQALQIAAQVPAAASFAPGALPDSQPTAPAAEPASASVDIAALLPSQSNPIDAPALSSATRATLRPAAGLTPVPESPSQSLAMPASESSNNATAPSINTSSLAQGTSATEQAAQVSLPSAGAPAPAQAEPGTAPIAAAPAVRSQGVIDVPALAGPATTSTVSAAPAASPGHDTAAPSLVLAGASPSGSSTAASTTVSRSLPSDGASPGDRQVRLPGAPTPQAATGGPAGESASPGVPLALSNSRGPSSLGAPRLGIESSAILSPPRASTGSGSPARPLSIVPGTSIAEPTRAAGSPPRTSTALPAGTAPSLASTVELPFVGAIPDPPETFSQRDPELREGVLESMGGSAETERAVKLALDWFKSHQHADGRWSGRHFDDGCGRCGGESEIEADAAITSITLLCYLSAGHTHLSDGPYRELVASALKWLIDRQSPNGDLRGGETMYSHDIATVAVCEAFAMTRDPRIGEAARRAVSFMLVAQSDSGRSGRTAQERAQSTSVLGWQVMALATAKRCGFELPENALAAPRNWLDHVSTPDARGRYAHRRGDEPSAAMTAEAMFVQQLLGRQRIEPRMRQSAAFVLQTPPRWADGAPTYYWYYATLALFEHQGDEWRQWNERLVQELIKHQRTDGPAAGSWDPQDYWSRLAGRIYQTAVCTLSLEVYYRYRPAGVESPAPGLETRDRRPPR